MTPPPDPPSLEILLAEGDFVRGLVRGLLRGRDGEDDIAQGTWLRALRAAPGDASRLRQWLSRVARNLVRDHRRDAGRRSEHERAAARPEALPSPADVVQREEERRRVVDAVLGLGEPYRTTLLLRFWEDLPPHAIARRLGLPQGTVRARISRGLDLLRGRLDGEFGDRRAWVTALVPLAGHGETAHALTGALLMSNRLAASLAALLVLGLALFLAVPLLFDDPAAPPDDAATRVDARVAGGGDSAAAAGPGNGADASEAPAPAARTALDPQARFTVRGRVELRPRVARATALRFLVYPGYAAAGTPLLDRTLDTAPDGSFEVDAAPPDTAVVIVVRGADTERLRGERTCYVARGERPPFVALTLGCFDCEVTGRVTGGDGAPLAGATVNMFDFARTATDRDGRYRLMLPAHDVTLGARAPGFAGVSLRVVIPRGSTHHRQDFALVRGATLRGRVVDERGHGIEGAKVSASTVTWQPVTSAADGTFVIDHLRPGEQRYHVHADKPGLVQAAGQFALGEPVRLVMGDGVTLRGMVVDAADRPVESAEVFVRDASLDNDTPDAITDAAGRFAVSALRSRRGTLAVRKRGFALALQVLNGHDDVVVVVRPGRRVHGTVRDVEGAPVEGVLVTFYSGSPGRDGFLGIELHTDAQGRFETLGLPDITLSVLALREGYMRTAAEGITGGPIELRMARAGRLAGRVVDASTGRALPAFRVRILDGIGLAASWGAGHGFEDPGGLWDTGREKIAPGRAFEVEVEAPGYAPERRSVTAAVDARHGDNEFRLWPGVVMTGVVRDEASGSPVEKVLVEVLGDGDTLSGRDGLRRVALIQTDAAGRFRTHPVAAGAHRLAFGAAGHPRQVTEPIEVGRGPGEHALEIRLHAGVTLQGGVTGFAGATRVRVTPLHRTDGGGEHRAALVEGSFRIEGLEAGLYQVSPEPLADGHAFAVHVQVAGRGPVVLDLDPQQGDRTLHGVVEGIDRGVVWLHPSSEDGAPRHRQPATRSAPVVGGRFELTGLAPGVYRVEARAGARGCAAQVDLRPGSRRLEMRCGR